MEFTGSIIGVNIDVVTKEATVTFKVDNRQAVLDGYDELKDSRLTITANKYRQKRSLDANAYFWVLAGKLASKLHTTTTEVYRQYIYDVGDNFRIVPIREDLIGEWEKLWCKDHVGRMVEDLGECRNTTGYHNIRCFFGSSDYNTKQMSRLIDLIVQDCKEQGIETMSLMKLTF